MTVPGVVGLVEDGQRDLAGFADQRAHLHGHDVTGGNIGQPLPIPCACRGVHDLDAVGESALNLVATLGAYPASRFLSVDEELRRLTGTFVGRHGEIEVLPAVSVNIADLTESRRDRDRW